MIKRLNSATKRKRGIRFGATEDHESGIEIILLLINQLGVTHYRQGADFITDLLKCGQA